MKEENIEKTDVKEDVSVQNAHDTKENKRDLKQVYEEVKQLLKEYVVLNEEAEYDIIATWILHTYMYESVGVTPYIKLYGMKETGKTAIMEICQKLVGNGKILSDANKAHVYREISQGTKVLFLDEFESMRDADRRDMEAILNAGYKKSGNVVRCTGADYETKNFPLFCPKMLATTQDIESVTLNDRCIEIITTRAEVNLKSTTSLSPEDLTKLEQLKKDIEAVMTSNKAKIIENYTQFSEAIGRIKELVGPLASIAKEVNIEENILKHFTKERLEKQELDLENDWDYKILRTLQKIARDVKTDYYVKTITNYARNEENMGWITAAKVGRRLKRLGFKSETRSNEGIHYLLNKEDINKAIKRNGYKDYFLADPLESALSTPATA